MCRIYVRRDMTSKMDSTRAVRLLSAQRWEIHEAHTPLMVDARNDTGFPRWDGRFGRKKKSRRMIFKVRELREKGHGWGGSQRSKWFGHQQHWIGIPSWELTYPIPRHFWRWFSFSRLVGICIRFLEGIYYQVSLLVVTFWKNTRWVGHLSQPWKFRVTCFHQPKRARKRRIARYRLDGVFFVQAPQRQASGQWNRAVVVFLCFVWGGPSFWGP